MCRGRCRGRCENTVGLHVLCFKQRFLNLNFFLREMQSDCVFTTSPTPSPTHPLSVPYTSPTSPTNVPRFQAFRLKEMQWHRQGNHAIDKFMANVAATIGEQRHGMMPGSSRLDTGLRLGNRPLRLQSRAPRCHKDALTFEGALECGAMQRFRVAFNFKTALHVNLLLRLRVSLRKRRLVAPWSAPWRRFNVDACNPDRTRMR